MKILVIGGTRFIGLALVHALGRMGHAVAVFNRGKSPGELPADVERITGDMNDLESHRRAFAAFAPEIVIHNMVLHDGHVQSLQAAFRGIARRVIMTSSMDVYGAYGRLNGNEPGDPLPTPADEDSPLRESRFPYRALPNVKDDPNHPYYRYDKIPAEQAALSDPDLPGTVLRLPMVFGPGDFQRRLLPYVMPMRDQRPAIVLDSGLARHRSTFGYVENVAAAMALASVADRAIGRVYNVADCDLSWLELAQLVKAEIGWNGQILTAPSDELPEALRADFDTRHDLVVSADRIRRELGFRPVVDLKTAIQRTVTWDLANPPKELPPDAFNYAATDEYLAALKG